MFGAERNVYLKIKIKMERCVTYTIVSGASIAAKKRRRRSVTVKGESNSDG